MADSSLTDLFKDGAAKAPMSDGTPKATPMPEAQVNDIARHRSDDLMAKAQAHISLDRDEESAVKLFMTSQQLIEAKMDEDPAYAQQLIGKLQDKQGQDLANAVIDEADNSFRIPYMEKMDPSRFNSGQAFGTALLNEAMFGQLSRVAGLAGQTIEGRDWKEVAEEQGERFRLLAKAYPKADLAGIAAAYMIPGSPAKKVFEKAAGLGARVVGKALTKVTKVPGLLEKTVQTLGNRGSQLAAEVAYSAGSGMAGAATTEGIKGTLGEGTQGISFDRGAERAAVAATFSGAAAAILHAGAGGVQAAARAAKPIVGPQVKAFAQGVQQSVDSGLEQLTGVSPAALRAWNTRAGAIRAAFGTEKAIGEDLMDFLMDPKRSKIAESQVAEGLLPYLPDVDARGLINHLKGIQKGTNPKLDPVVGELHEWAARFEKQLGKDGKVSARTLRTWVDDLQGAVDDGKGYGKETTLYLSALKQAGRIGRMEIVGAADDLVRGVMKNPSNQAEYQALRNALAIGDDQAAAPFLRKGVAVGDDAFVQASQGAGYTANMEKAFEKVQLLKFIRRQLGTDVVVMENRAKGFVTDLFGNRKEVLRARLGMLDQKFGTNFLAGAEEAHMARQLNPNTGVPSLFSNLMNGKAGVGAIVGGGIGGVVGGAAGAMSGEGWAKGAAKGSTIGTGIGVLGSSPKAATKLIGASDNITGFVRALVGNPDALARIAGSVGRAATTTGYGSSSKGLAGMAKDAAAKKATQLRVPMIVGQLAQEIQKTLRKDGPVAASGVVRLIADTPYFVGLVHAFDLAQQRQANRNLETGLAKVRQQQESEIATPKQ